MQDFVDPRLFVSGQHAGAHQRLRVGAAPRDVLAVKPAIDIKRACEAIDQRVGLFAKPPAPGLLAQCATFDIRLASTSQGKPPICAAGPQSAWLKLRLCSPRISGKKSEWALSRDSRSMVP